MNASEDLNLTANDRKSILHRREWTFILDGIIIGFVNLAAGSALGDTYESTSIKGILIPFIYFLLKDTFAGRSIGKIITGLRVVDANSREPIGIGKSIARNWILLIPLMPIVELIVANLREDKRRLGDLIANTLVVKIKTLAEQYHQEE